MSEEQRTNRATNRPELGQFFTIVDCAEFPDAESREYYRSYHDLLGKVLKVQIFYGGHFGLLEDIHGHKESVDFRFIERIAPVPEKVAYNFIKQVKKPNENRPPSKQINLQNLLGS